MEEKITYIIVTWNNENEIRECLDSIEKYSSSPHKILVVDNKSTDQTVKIIREEYKQAVLAANDVNMGFAKANNVGLEMVKSPYVCFLNPDVILTEDIAAPSIKELEGNRDIGLVSCRLNNRDGSWQPSTFSFANSKNMFNEILHIGAFMPQSICRKRYINYYHPTERFYPDWVIGAEMVMRTPDAKAVGGFSTEYYMYTEDMDLCKKVDLYLKKKILFLPDHSLVHLGGASESQNISYDKQKKLFENDLFFVKKFYGEKEAQKTKEKMIQAYRIRLHMLKMFYQKHDRDFQIEKTEKALEMIEGIRR